MSPENRTESDSQEPETHPEGRDLEFATTVDGSGAPVAGAAGAEADTNRDSDPDGNRPTATERGGFEAAPAEPAAAEPVPKSIESAVATLRGRGFNFTALASHEGIELPAEKDKGAPIAPAVGFNPDEDEETFQQKLRAASLETAATAETSQLVIDLEPSASAEEKEAVATRSTIKSDPPTSYESLSWDTLRELLEKADKRDVRNEALLEQRARSVRSLKEQLEERIVEVVMLQAELEGLKSTQVIIETDHSSSKNERAVLENQTTIASEPPPAGENEQPNAVLLSQKDYKTFWEAADAANKQLDQKLEETKTELEEAKTDLQARQNEITMLEAANTQLTTDLESAHAQVKKLGDDIAAIEINAIVSSRPPAAPNKVPSTPPPQPQAVIATTRNKFWNWKKTVGALLITTAGTGGTIAYLKYPTLLAQLSHNVSSTWKDLTSIPEPDSEPPQPIIKPKITTQKTPTKTLETDAGAKKHTPQEEPSETETRNRYFKKKLEEYGAQATAEDFEQLPQHLKGLHMEAISLELFLDKNREVKKIEWHPLIPAKKKLRIPGWTKVDNSIWTVIATYARNPQDVDNIQYFGEEPTAIIQDENNSAIKYYRYQWDEYCEEKKEGKTKWDVSSIGFTDQKSQKELTIYKIDPPDCELVENILSLEKEKQVE